MSSKCGDKTSFSYNQCLGCEIDFLIINVLECRKNNLHSSVWHAFNNLLNMFKTEKAS